MKDVFFMGIMLYNVKSGRNFWTSHSMQDNRERYSIENDVAMSVNTLRSLVVRM